MAVTDSDCLLNCLREVRLDRFHQNFTERGLTNCEQLSSLIVDDYGRFGVVSTNDRHRLFQLIQIIKSVQADGVHCQHGAKITELNGVPQTTGPNKSVPLPEELPDVARNGIVPAPKIAAWGDADTGKCPMAPTRHFIKPIFDDCGYRVQYELPRLHITQEAKVVTKNVAAAAADSGLGTPTFNCRKMLTFSDSDVHSDGGDISGCDGMPTKLSCQTQISDCVTLSSPAARPSRLRPPQVVKPSSVSSPRAFVIPAEHKPMTRHRSSGSRISQTESQNSYDQQEFPKDRKSRQVPQNGQPMKKIPSQNDVSHRHAYFPTAKIPAQEELPVHIEQIYHSKEYNYGVPGSTMHRANKVHSVHIFAFVICICTHMLYFIIVLHCFDTVGWE